MFGMGFFEIVIIVIVAVIFLGPEKLPQAIIDVVKFFKIMRNAIHDAKQTLDNELQLSDLKKEASSYHQQFTEQIDALTNDIKLEEIKQIPTQIKQEYNAIHTELHNHTSTPKASLPPHAPLASTPNATSITPQSMPPLSNALDAHALHTSSSQTPNSS